MEIEKYNSIVNTAEKQMMTLRSEYAQAVDSRNLTGIQLIDRNDECCILYEKKNIQTDILKKGEGALTEIEEQIKLVRINISETNRRVEVSRKKIPSLAIYADAVKLLETVEKLLSQERKLTNDLCEQLETPHYIEGEDSAQSVDNRSRLLGGLDPEPEQLAAKTEILEERLNDKKEQLLEKELVLDEVSSLTDKLRMQAAENRGNTLVLAQKVNAVQGQIRAIVRKMMATVSELSMYQATAMKLEQQKGHEMDTLHMARSNLSEGTVSSACACCVCRYMLMCVWITECLSMYAYTKTHSHVSQAVRPPSTPCRSGTGWSATASAAKRA
jgi:chromosome segregation ATPase